MRGIALAAVLFVSACGDAVDDRPATLQYIVPTILAPSCGKAQCHSTFKQEEGDVFDTVEGARFSLVTYGNVIADSDVDAPENSRLVQFLTVGAISVNSGEYVRMPYDEPLPEEDINLIIKWIGTRDALGLGAPGAQCVPNDQGHGCIDAVKVVACSPDGNVMDLNPIETCGQGENCSETGECIPD